MSNHSSFGEKVKLSSKDQRKKTLKENKTYTSVIQDFFER